MRGTGRMLLRTGVKQHVVKGHAALEHAVVVQRRRTAKAHEVAGINDTNGGLVAVHESGLVAVHLKGSREGRGQLYLQPPLQLGHLDGLRHVALQLNFDV